jgi:serine/threonine protein kinase
MLELVLEVGGGTPTLVMVMPLYRGTLRMALATPADAQRVGENERAWRARMVQEVAKALIALHAMGILHRDVKPQNVFIDADGGARLGDYGLAYDRALHLPGAEMACDVASAWYRAPELLFLQRRYGGAVDVWSLGCLAWEIWTGAPLMHTPVDPNGYISEDRLLATMMCVLGDPADAAHGWDELRDLRGWETWGAAEAARLRACGLGVAAGYRVVRVGPHDDAIRAMLAYNPAQRPTAAGAFALLMG